MVFSGLGPLSLERMFYYIKKFKLTVAQPGIINAQVGRCIYQPRRNEGYMIQVEGEWERGRERVGSSMMYCMIGVISGIGLMMFVP